MLSQLLDDEEIERKGVRGLIKESECPLPLQSPSQARRRRTVTHALLLLLDTTYQYAAVLLLEGARLLAQTTWIGIGTFSLCGAVKTVNDHFLEPDRGVGAESSSTGPSSTSKAENEEGNQGREFEKRSPQVGWAHGSQISSNLPMLEADHGQFRHGAKDVVCVGGHENQGTLAR
jgi:hypothetical protein